MATISCALARADAPFKTRRSLHFDSLIGHRST
eukprot:CAMPEP_0172701140 /NCGR_PEP_ID=MMETSP1074-20121228/31422_1 /TAXON_ID=2916 /ORGANISM="Ceratium fusus, Strain PA161109" /LENGTH=32 /DNA_ID= /DNA_START= /DNA_END= /DNA_ORIENTATION=